MSSLFLIFGQAEQIYTLAKLQRSVDLPKLIREYKIMLICIGRCAQHF